METEKLGIREIRIQFLKAQARVITELKKSAASRKRRTSELVNLGVALMTICDSLADIEVLGIRKLEDCQEWLTM